MKKKEEKNINNQVEIPNYKLFVKNIAIKRSKNTHKRIDEKKINYKNIELLKTFITEEKGKIIPSRLNGLSAKNQRKITRAIKQARQILLLP